MKILVIGGGFFGTSVAIKIKEKYKKFSVTLVEKKKDIFLGASGKNQFRCHSGYHYPRSNKTIEECRASFEEFNKYFGNTFIKSENYYAISKENSKIDFNNYLKSLDKNHLKYKIIKTNLLNTSNVEGVISVNEKIINIDLVRKKIWKYLNKLNVDVLLNKEIKLSNEVFLKYDKIILCTYDQNNNNLLEYEPKKKKYFYQLVEKILIKPHPNFYKKSIVILDGPFMCIDPYQNTNLSILGSVRGSVITEKLSITQNYNEHYSYLEKYLVNSFKNSKFRILKNSFKKYFNYFDDIEYFKSFYVIRATLKNKNDDRVSKVIKKNKLSIVFSGKWVNCIISAKKVVDEIEK